MKKKPEIEFKTDKMFDEITMFEENKINRNEPEFYISDLINQKKKINLFKNARIC